MRKLTVILPILVTVLAVAVIFSYIPVQKATTVHNTIIGTLGKVTVQELTGPLTDATLVDFGVGNAKRIAMQAIVKTAAAGSVSIKVVINGQSSVNVNLITSTGAIGNTGAQEVIGEKVTITVPAGVVIEVAIWQSGTK